MTKSRRWTEEEDAVLKEKYFTHQRSEIAKSLDRTLGSLRKRCSVLGLNQKHLAWTEEDEARMRDWYVAHGNGLLDLPLLAEQMGRTPQFISRQAKKAGLLVPARPLPDVARQAIGNHARKRIREEGHPRGMLGKKHTADTLKRISESHKGWNERTPPDDMESRNDKMMKTRIARYGTGNPGLRTSSNPYSRTKSGKREDLENRFFRSSWEANYARYLNFLLSQGTITKWEYEPKTFVFHGVIRGVLTYTPDFLVEEKDGTKAWHEVKGWMDAKSKAKLKRMAKFYPDEKIVLIDAAQYKAISKFKGLIPNWE